MSDTDRILDEAIEATSAYWCAVARIAEGCKAMAAKDYDRAAGWFGLAGEMLHESAQCFDTATRVMLERAMERDRGGSAAGEVPAAEDGESDHGLPPSKDNRP